MSESCTGLYIHIPFCIGKCPYCDFYSVVYDDWLSGQYYHALLRAMDTAPFGTLNADTLYFGGGTPTLMGARRLCMLLEHASRRFGISGHSEITLEANPDTVDIDLLRSLKESGYNRISFGVQSLSDVELIALGRRHDAGTAKRAVENAARCGFDNISVDLMLGIPLQTRDSLAGTIRNLSGLPVNHVSAYLLKIEPDTPFGFLTPPHPDDDECAELYLDCVSLLEQDGFAQYEISNFTRDGARCQHNLNYWQCGGYLGVGPAAHSFLNGRRFYFSRDLHGFTGAARPFALAQDDGSGGSPEELLLLGLRLREGFDTARLSEFGIDPEPVLCAARKLSGHGLCEISGTIVSLTKHGFLLSNSVTVSLLDALEG